MVDCFHVSVKEAEAYPSGTVECQQCGAIVPPADVDSYIEEVLS